MSIESIFALLIILTPFIFLLIPPTKQTIKPLYHKVWSVNSERRL